MSELLLYSKDAQGQEIECRFKHLIDYKEALSSGKYFRKGDAPEKGRAPDILDIDTMTLEQLHQLAEFENLLGWRVLERAALVTALKARRADNARRLAEQRSKKEGRDAA
jgi:hypothetical protein